MIVESILLCDSRESANRVYGNSVKSRIEQQIGVTQVFTKADVLAKPKAFSKTRFIFLHGECQNSRKKRLVCASLHWNAFLCGRNRAGVCKTISATWRTDRQRMGSQCGSGSGGNGQPDHSGQQGVFCRVSGVLTKHAASARWRYRFDLSRQL